MSRGNLITIITLVGAVVLLVWASLPGKSIACEVCVEFRGRGPNCGSALAETQEEAQRVATDNACAVLTGGMTESIQCSRTLPVSVSCEER